MEWVRDELGREYGYLMVQPTIPEITAGDLERFMDAARQVEWAECIVMTTHAPHLYWHGHKLATPRKNRQAGNGETAQELGVRFYMANGGYKDVWGAWELDRSVIDIDSWGDLTEIAAQRQPDSAVISLLSGWLVLPISISACSAISAQATAPIMHIMTSCRRATRRIADPSGCAQPGCRADG